MAYNDDQLAQADEEIADAMHVELLQRSKEVSRQQAQQARTASQAPEGVNCTAYPMFCSPKVNCSTQPLTDADRTAMDTRLSTPDGHANLRSWCLAYPAYARSLQTCVLDNNKSGYAQDTYDAQVQAGLDTADAVYCMVAGHCNNTEVTLDTTLEEAEGICDRQYGHDRWTKIGWKDFTEVLAKAQTMVAEQAQALSEGRIQWADLVKLARHESEISAMTACAMGNYHCDVVYCKRNYCGKQLYQRFANLSWSY